MGYGTGALWDLLIRSVLSSLEGTAVVVTTICSATSDDEVGNMIIERFSVNRKWQDYVYIQCEYKSTKQKIKHLLREENKVKENKIS